MHLIFLLAAFIVILVFGMEFVKRFGTIIMIGLLVFLTFQFLAGPQSIGRGAGKLVKYAARTTQGMITGFSSEFGAK